jgi:hypothetical protein
VAVVLGLTAALLLALLIASLRDGGNGSSVTTHGSGSAATEHRELADFTRIELAGTNRVTVRVGAAQSVAVTADDNLLDQVTTTVRGGNLVIGDRGSFTVETPMSVAISVPSLDGVTLSGTGAMTVEGVTGTEFVADLFGTGALKVSGTADRLTAVLSGTGTLDLPDLVAREVTARLDGTGEIHVHATSSLDATLTGTGSIVYAGEPAVTAHNTGTGSIKGE